MVTKEQIKKVIEYTDTLLPVLSIKIFNFGNKPFFILVDFNPFLLTKL
jgi:hypothetical protein